MKRASLVVMVVAVTAALASNASASQLVDRNATGDQARGQLEGRGALTYKARGKQKHVLAWGAVNAIAPTRSRQQLAFKLDYAGGWGKYHSDYWKTFKNSCGAYDGPKLAWFVTGCTAPDGSYWALQAWQRMLAELRRDGERGPVGVGASPLTLDRRPPVLTIDTDWAWHQWDHLFGTFTYNGQPVFGFKATPGGNPLDTFGRNVYVDTFDSAYGKGWMRENSFLTHTNTGAFCYSVNPHGEPSRGQGHEVPRDGRRPRRDARRDVAGASPGAYDKAADLVANDAIAQLGDAPVPAATDGSACSRLGLVPDTGLEQRSLFRRWPAGRLDRRRRGRRASPWAHGLVARLALARAAARRHLGRALRLDPRAAARRGDVGGVGARGRSGRARAAVRAQRRPAAHRSGTASTCARTTRG